MPKGRSGKHLAPMHTTCRAPCVQRFLTLQRLKQRSDDSKLIISKGNAGTFVIDADIGGGRGGRGGGGGGGSGGGGAAATSGVRVGKALQGALDAARSRSNTAITASASGRTPTAALLRGGRGGWDLVGDQTNSLAGRVENPAPSSTSNTTQWGSKIRVGPAPAAPSSVVRVRRGGARSASAARSALGITPPSASKKRAASGDLLILADNNSLSYLDGTLPGDMGFDPLGLFAPGADVGFMNQRWLRYAEVIHGRWAMLGVVGCLAPEFLAYEGIIPQERGVIWFKTGFLPLAGQDFDFGTDLVSLTWIMLLAMGFAETRRIQDFINPGSLATGHHLPLALDRALSTPPGQDPVYPGGPIFNFMGVVESESATQLFKEKETRHGRLAMVACFGIFAQALATRDGPYINLLDHLFDPLNVNILTNLREINE